MNHKAKYISITAVLMLPHSSRMLLQARRFVGTNARPNSYFGKSQYIYQIIGSTIFAIAAAVGANWYIESDRTRRHKSIAADIAREQWRQSVLEEKPTTAPAYLEERIEHTEGIEPKVLKERLEHAVVVNDPESRKMARQVKTIDDGFAAAYMHDSKNQKDVAEAYKIVTKVQTNLSALQRGEQRVD